MAEQTALGVQTLHTDLFRHTKIICKF